MQVSVVRSTHLVNWFSYYRMMMVTKATRSRVPLLSGTRIFLSFDFHCGTLKTIIYKYATNADKTLTKYYFSYKLKHEQPPIANQLLSRVSSYCLMNETFGEPKYGQSKRKFKLLSSLLFTIMAFKVGAAFIEWFCISALNDINLCKCYF